MTKHYKYILAALLILTGLASGCRPEHRYQEETGPGNGIAKVTIPYSFVEPQSMTRAKLTEDQERIIHDFYLLVFSKDDSSVVFRKYYNTWMPGTDSHLQSVGKIEIPALPYGDYQIRAVTNVRDNVLKDNLKDALDGVKNLTQYNELSLRHIEPAKSGVRYGANLVMAGAYFEGDPHAEAFPTPTIFRVDRPVLTLPGKIHLERLTSYIRFEVINQIGMKEEDKDKKKCLSFEVIDWKVVRVPAATNLSRKSYIEGKETNYVDIPATYESDKIEEKKGKIGTGSRSFGFYMFQNIKSNKNPNETPKNWKERSLESKDEAGKIRMQSDGKHRSFKFADDYSTYVQIRVRMELEVPSRDGKNIKVRRLAETTYNVHLGAARSKSNPEAEVDLGDYTIKRNSNYTYKLFINDAEEVVVEATTDTDSPDFNNSSEGDVVDFTSARAVSCDTHYAVFNITLTPSQIHRTGISIFSPLYGTQTYTFNSENLVIGRGLDPKSPDYLSIRIAEAPSKGELVNFSTTYDVLSEGVGRTKPLDPMSPYLFKENLEPGDNFHVNPLYDIIEWIRKYGDVEEGGAYSDAADTPLHFTIFLNEYIYYHEKNWSEYTNIDDRKYTFFVSRVESKDLKSTYQDATYVITQRSPQAYLKSSANKIGTTIEHINETRGSNLNHRGPVYTKKVIAHMTQTLSDMNINSTNLVQQSRFHGYLNNVAYLLSKAGGGYTDGENEAVLFATGDGRTTPLPNKTAPNKYDHLWAAFTDPTVPQEEYPIMKSRPYPYKEYSSRGWIAPVLHPKSKDPKVVYDSMYSAWTRNRDLNRDGYIQFNELRWFLPTTPQYSEFILAGPVLRSKLFSPNNYNSALGNIYGNKLFHILGSDNKHVWLEEGYSTGKGGKNALEIKVMRYLGEDDPTKVKDLPKGYTYEGDFRFNLDRVDDDLIRSNVKGSAGLILHEVFDGSINKPARRFEFGKKPIIIRPNDDNYKKYFTSFEAFREAVNSGVLTRDYSQEIDESDKGSWRIPNIAELRIFSSVNDFGLIRESLFKPENKNLGKEPRVLSCSTWADPFTSLPRQYMHNGVDLSIDPDTGRQTGHSYIMTVAPNLGIFSMRHPINVYVTRGVFVIFPIRDLE